MMNIAICDDDKATTAEIEEKILTIGQEQNMKVECSIFFDGATLTESICQGNFYDLVYLDIEMPQVNGLKVAKLIRDMELPTLLIYISNYEKYLMDLVNTEPFRFLLKPIDSAFFRRAFMAAHKKITQDTQYFSYTYNKSIHRIPLRNICYFESRNRVVHIHLAKYLNTESTALFRNHNKFYGKINAIEEELQNYTNLFVRIHQSYLVNFDYIRCLNYSSVVMCDGVTLPISEDRQKNVRTLFCTMAGIEV